MKTRPVPKFVDRSTLAHWHSYTTPTIAPLGSLHHYHSLASCASKRVRALRSQISLGEDRNVAVPRRPFFAIRGAISFNHTREGT